MSKVKVAIIGCGGIANQKHFPALKNNSDLNEIVAFCDIKIERAQKAAAEFGVAGAQVTADYREVLANPAVEVVHICTPNVSHSEIAIAAFEAKKHVYCEKPMSHSTVEAEKMVEAWKKSGMQFTVGYQNRFRPEVQNLHTACQKGDLGVIIVGIREDLPYEFKIPSPKPYKNVDVTCKNAIENPPIGKEAYNNELTKQSEIVVKRLKYIKPGENAFTADLPEELQLKVKGAKISQIYKRLDPDKPAYTVTGSGGGGTHMYHYSEPRALTNRERARLQTFPDNYIFEGSKESVRKQIGMAVPAKGAKIIFEAILRTFAGIDYESVEPSIKE